MYRAWSPCTSLAAKLVEVQGFEPRQTESKSVVLTVTLYLYGTSPQIRTVTKGFGDLCATVTPMTYNGVIDGTRTRNNQNHNLGLYH